MSTPTKIEKFVEEYGKLVQKHGVDYATFPQFIPDGKGGFQIVCQTVPVDLEEHAEAKRKSFVTKNV